MHATKLFPITEEHAGIQSHVDVVSFGLGHKALVGHYDDATTIGGDRMALSRGHDGLAGSGGHFLYALWIGQEVIDDLYLVISEQDGIAGIGVSRRP